MASPEHHVVAVDTETAVSPNRTASDKAVDKHIEVSLQKEHT